MKNHEYRKPIEFTVPAHGDGAFYVMEDIGSEFYGYYHRHREFQLTYIVKGHGSLIVGNLLRPCSDNELFLLKPNDPHLFFKDDSLVDDVQIHVVHLFFSLEKLEPFFDLAELQTIKNLLYNLTSSKVISLDFAPQIKEAFLTLNSDEGPHKLIRILEIFDFIRQSESELVSLYSGFNKMDIHDFDGVRINSVVKYAIQNYKRSITVEEVSSLIHMTPTAFCKFFKKHTMKRFVSFLNELRVEKACQLLVNHRVDSISEAAYQCGFNTAVHFNRVFKSVMRVSP